MERAQYLREESWRGSYFELALELGTVDDDRAQRALETLWAQPALVGPWAGKADFRGTVVAPKLDAAPLVGCLALDGATELGCLSFFIREEGGSDWLDLSIPTGMLELAFPVAYPLDDATNPWIQKLERALVGIAARVFEVVPFRMGLLGEEASGTSEASELTTEMCERGGVLVPLALWQAQNPRRVPELIAPGLVYASFLGPHIAYGR